MYYKETKTRYRTEWSSGFGNVGFGTGYGGFGGTYRTGRKGWGRSGVMRHWQDDWEKEDKKVVAHRPEDYWRPSDGAIGWSARRCGISHEAYGLVRAIAYKNAGGELKSDAELLEVQKATGKRLSELMQLRAFVEVADCSMWEGYTPIEKACAFLSQLQNEKLGRTIEKVMTSPCGQDRAIRSAKQLVKERGKIPHEIRILFPGKDATAKAQMYRYTGRHFEKIQALLQAAKGTRTYGSTLSMPDVMGEDVTSEAIASLNQLARVKAIEWAYPKTIRLARALQGTSRVRMRAYTKRCKQCIVMALDASGSMDGLNWQKAVAVALNRLAAVAQGKAWLSIYLFGEYVKHWGDVSTLKQAQDIARELCKHRANSGATYLNRAIIACVKKAQELLDDDSARLVRPEVIVVTDGEAVISKREIAKANTAEARVHVFEIGSHNDKLREYARETGGCVFEV